MQLLGAFGMHVGCQSRPDYIILVSYSIQVMLYICEACANNFDAQV